MTISNTAIFSKGEQNVQIAEERVKSRQAAAMTDMTLARLLGLVRAGKCPAPAKDSSGHYWWSERDLEHARRAAANDRRFRRNRTIG
jgi:hypothetical protein